MNNEEEARSKPVAEAEASEVIIIEQTAKGVASEDILKMLGDDSLTSEQIKINFKPELINTWKKWMQEGISERMRDKALELYPRNGELNTEAPKINLEVLPIVKDKDMTEKRDSHFLRTQNCTGAAITALGAAMTMLIEMNEEEGLDQEVFSNHLSFAGQLMTDIFHQLSNTRKSFITPLLNKKLKPTLEATVSDEWLYGKKFAEQVKEAKDIEKACSGIKSSDKPKSTNLNNYQGNASRPPVKNRQVGSYSRKPMIKFRGKTHQTNSNSSRTYNKKRSQSYHKK